jgi:hypothetical protein
MMCGRPQTPQRTMRNLVLLRETVGPILPTPVAYTAIDSASKRMYLVTADLRLVTYKLDGATVEGSVRLAADPSDAAAFAGDNEYLETNETVVCLQYLSELESVVVVTRQGNIMTVNIATQQVTVPSSC